MLLQFSVEFIFILASVLIILGLRFFLSVKKIQLGTILIFLSLFLVVFSAFLDTSLKNYEWIFSALLLGSVFGVIASKKIRTDSFPNLLVFFWLLNGVSATLFLFQVFLYHPSMKFGIYGYVLYFVLVGLFILGLVVAISFLLFLKLTQIVQDESFHYPLQNFLNLILFLLIFLLGVFIVYKENTDTNLLFIYFGLSLSFGIFFFSGISRFLDQVYFSILNILFALNLLFLGVLFENYFILIIGTFLLALGFKLYWKIQKYFNLSWKIFFNSKLYFQTQNLNSFQEVDIMDASFLVHNSQKIFILPGLEFIFSNAQFVCKQFEELLKENGAKVKYIIHPFGGKIFGHMNLVLSEANIEYENFIEIPEANLEIANTDLVFVIGANNLMNLVHSNPSSFDEYSLNLLQAKRILILTQYKKELKQFFQDQSFEKKVYVIQGEPRIMLARLLEQIQKYSGL